MPAYPLLRNENSIFDVRNTPTGAGLIAEEFRHYPGVKRSLNRQHSVCALGPMSDFLLGEHHLSKTCWDEKSPYYKLGEINAIVFTLGLGKVFVGLCYIVQKVFYVVKKIHILLPFLRKRLHINIEIMTEI